MFMVCFYTTERRDLILVNAGVSFLKCEKMNIHVHDCDGVCK